MKPGKALKAGKALARKGTLKRVGKRKAREIEKFGAFRKAWLREHPWCEICMVLAIDGIVLNPRPLHRADAIHERQKRSAGGSLIEPSNLLSACAHSNGWIEDNPRRARKLGLVVYSWEDPSKVAIAMQDVLDWQNDDDSN